MNSLRLILDLKFVRLNSTLKFVNLNSIVGWKLLLQVREGKLYQFFLDIIIEKNTLL